jgi:hypothetical protein
MIFHLAQLAPLSSSAKAGDPVFQGRQLKDG